jgi:hypothetical protein
MKRTPILLSTVLSLAAFPAISAHAGETPPPPKVLVGHVCAISPTGMDQNFNPVPYKDSGITENLTLRNIPFGGKLYRIEAKNGKVTATQE